MAKSGFVIKLLKSRNNILDILSSRGFNIENYENQSVNEIDIMYQNEQMDMLVENPDTKKKVYIKYHLAKTLRHSHINDYIDDLYVFDNVLTKDDELIIIARDGPNDSVIKVLKQLWIEDKYYINVFGIKSLQFNVTKHVLVPPHRVLSELEKKEVFKKYNIMNESQLPDISRFSLISMAIGIRPNEVCEILRPSKTSIVNKFYRICSG